MMRVLVKMMTYVNGQVHRAGEEITIMSHLFSKEVHELLEDLGLAEHEPKPPEPDPAPAAETVSPPVTSPPAATPPGEPLTPEAAPKEST